MEKLTTCQCGWPATMRKYTELVGLPNWIIECSDPECKCRVQGIQQQVVINAWTALNKPDDIRIKNATSSGNM